MRQAKNMSEKVNKRQRSSEIKTKKNNERARGKANDKGENGITKCLAK